MDPEQLKPTSLVSQHEVFFTQENYKKHSCRPSFVEFLEKHLSPDKDEQNRLPQNDITMGSSEAAEYNMSKATSKTGAEKSRSNSAAACLGPAMEFPFISKISIESQEMFLKILETLRSGKLANVDLQEMKAVQDIKNAVMMEQEEYQQFVHTHVKTNHHLYNFIHPDIWNCFKMEVEGKFNEGINKYPRFYSLQETIGLAAGAVFKSDAVLTFERTLLQVGNVPKLCFPENINIMLSEVSALSDENATVMTSSAVKTSSPKVVSEDPIAVSLAKKHKVDIVISSSGLNTLLDNQPSDYRRQWQLPITVQRQQDNEDKSSIHKVIFIDKPLPPHKVHPREVNAKFYKLAFRRLVCQKSGGGNTTPDDGAEKNAGSNAKVTEKLRSTDSEMARTDSESRKRRATEREDEIAETKKTKLNESGVDPTVQNLKKGSVSASVNTEEKFYVYNLWKFGKLKVLIRCSVDAYRAEPTKQNCFTFFSVLPKLEYQPNFGHEKLTCSEAASFWLSSYIRQNTKLICGRINVFNSKLLRVDELSINDILQQGAGFHPAQGMKTVFQVFQALKRLPEAKFILSHKSGEIHGCLYKSAVSNSSSLKCCYDLHKARTPVVVNYTAAEIPRVAIDCNLFMPWQIKEKRIPCTFSPVPAKDLEMMEKKAQEATAKETNKKKKKNKKGKKKSNAGKAKGSGPKIPSTDALNEQVKKSKMERKSVNKGKLFASFYDTQPAEKESEVFAVSRRASGPVTYDDLDF